MASNALTTSPIPADLRSYIDRLDTFIAEEITPLQFADDNNRFFDHRREAARTDFTNAGLPRPEWHALLRQCTKLADKAGFWRFSLPRKYGGEQDDEFAGRGANLWMSVIREHLASKGLGLFNDLQTEHSVVGNFPVVVMFLHFGNQKQQEEYIWGMLEGRVRPTFGLTEPGHGSDATHMETHALHDCRNGVSGWCINGVKMWQSGMDTATHCAVFARTSGKAGSATGISCFIVPRNTPGVKVESYEWTFNMPTDHATVSFTRVWVPETALLGPLHGGLPVAQAFVHENRIRQAASSLGAAVYCINESVAYARIRRPFGKSLATNQAIQFPLVELHTQAQMLRLLIRETAGLMDSMPHVEVEKKLGDRVSMCNYWANRLCTQAADRAMQVHGGIGYSRHKVNRHSCFFVTNLALHLLG